MYAFDTLCQLLLLHFQGRFSVAGASRRAEGPKLPGARVLKRLAVTARRSRLESREVGRQGVTATQIANEWSSYAALAGAVAIVLVVIGCEWPEKLSSVRGSCRCSDRTILPSTIVPLEETRRRPEMRGRYW